LTAEKAASSKTKALEEEHGVEKNQEEEKE
jgi:hypothetical protein